MDSETLNNAPLNNPEHFLYPIKNRSDQTGGASESESESVGTSASLSKAGSRQNRSSSKSKKDEAEEGGEADSSTSDVDSDSSDDYPPEEKDRFVAQLYKFMDDRGTPMNKIPAVNKVDLDLHKFFIVVRKNGGYNKVLEKYDFQNIRGPL